MYFWLAPAIAALAAKTGLGFYQKVVMNDEYTALQIGTVWTVIGALFFIPAGLFQISSVNYTFTTTSIAILLGIGILEVIKSVIGLKALQEADLSLVTPLRKSGIVGLALLEPFVFAIDFSLYLIASTSLVVIGLFVTMTKPGVTSNRAITDTLTQKGPQLAIISGFLTILLSLGSRYGNTEFAPLTFGAFIYACLALGYLIWVKLEEGAIPFSLFKKPRFLGIGVIAIAQSFLTWTTYSLVSATVASTFFQLTIVTATLAGLRGLDEGNKKRRLIGVLIVFIGVVFTTRAGV